MYYRYILYIYICIIDIYYIYIYTYIYIYIFIYVNTKVRCTPRNMTNFNQKVKILKALNFRYDTET